MAERAHPGDLGFQDRWVLRWRWGGRLPWPHFERSPWKRGLTERYEFCLPHVRGKRVLDVPCGTGWGTSLLRGARSVLGIDVSAEAIEYGRAYYGRQAAFCLGDMGELPVAAGACDVVLCLEGIEHVSEVVGKAFVEEAARVLSPGGHVIVTSPIPDPRRPPNPYHIHEYEPDELEALFVPRFERTLWEVRGVAGVVIGYYVGCRWDGGAP